MGLLGKLTGARDGDPGVPPSSLADLRAALLAAGDGQPWSVADGAGHDCDLVASWSVASGPAAHSGSAMTFLVRLKLDEPARVVRHNSQQSGASWHTGDPGRAGESGYAFNSGDLTGPLRDTVTGHGWAWKAAFRL